MEGGGCGIVVVRAGEGDRGSRIRIRMGLLAVDGVSEGLLGMRTREVG